MFFKLTAQTQFIDKDTCNLPCIELVQRNWPRNWPTGRTSLGCEMQYNLIFILTLVGARLMPSFRETDLTLNHSRLCPSWVKEGSYGQFYPNITTAVI